MEEQQRMNFYNQTNNCTLINCFKPLGPFPTPVLETDVWEHILAVPTLPMLGWVVNGLQEAVVRVNGLLV